MRPSRDVRFVSIALLVAFVSQAHAATSATEEASSLAKPTLKQYLWHEQERIAFVCLDPCTWQRKEYDNHSTKLADMKLEKLNVEQWATAAKSWGAKEILLVCKHTGGFCWWPTETTDYCVKNIPWKNGKGNLVAEVADACRRNGLKIGIYIYPDDPKYMANIGRGGRTDDLSKQSEWNVKLRKQWEEVLTICGPDLIQEIWFDGSCIVPLEDIVQKLAPHAVILQSPLTEIRWVGNESGYAHDPNWNTLRTADLKSGVATEVHSTPDGDAWAPVECDTTLYDHFWFWSEQAERDSCKSLDKLMETFVHSIGRGSVLLLNSTPNTDGVIPERDAMLYKEFGETIAHEFGQPLASLADKTGSAVELDLGSPQAVNSMDLWEDYRLGHRIREYFIEARVNGRWQKVAEGTAVGRRKIDIFPEVLADRLRVNITKSVGTPLFRRLMAHRVSAELLAKCGERLSIARHASVTASSVHSAPYNAQFINDGNRSTRWGAKDDDPLSWVEYDLGRPHRFASTAISELANRVQSFVIEVRNSPDAPWRIIHNGATLGNNFKAELPATTARYVRLRITKLKELSATIWEWDLFDDVNAWEFVSEKPIPDAGETLDIDLSAQVPVPGQYEIRLDNAQASAVLPLFEGRPGDDRFVERLGVTTYNLNRTQAVGEGSSTGMRLSFKAGTTGTVKILARPR